MKTKLGFFLLFIIGLGWSPPLFPQVSETNTPGDRLSDTKVASAERLKIPGLRDTILGALLYLEDRQVRPRPGRGSLQWDSSDEGDGCKVKLCLNFPFHENFEVPAPPMVEGRNRTGEWASHIHFLPKKVGIKGRNLFAVQDSNLFMTAFIAYPLFLFDESGLPESRRHIANMLGLARRNIESFKRGEAFNFWAVLPGVRGGTERTGPFNIPVPLLEKLGKAFLNPRFDRLFRILSRGQKTPPKFWVSACLDPKVNPTGADALFNIPNDTDDTSTAVAFQSLYSKAFPISGDLVDRDSLRLFGKFRDLRRTREDGRDGWKPRGSGAFLTWLRPESEPTFGAPEKGVVPLGINNVDIVVNSNAAFSLALNGLKGLPGYRDCLALLASAVERKAWPEAGLYYPQFMIFPYSVTRAFRDGGAREGPMAGAMRTLLGHLLDVQEEYARNHSGRRGAFPGGEDRSDHLSTGLGVISLMNIGRRVAREIGREPEFDRGLDDGIRFLLREARHERVENETSRGAFATSDGKCATWETGLFFAASFWDLAHWRSEAFTVAIALEALTKYALAYDLDGSSFAERRLRLDPAPVR